MLAAAAARVVVGRGRRGDGAVEAALQEQGAGEEVGCVEAVDGEADDLVEGGRGADVDEGEEDGDDDGGDDGDQRDRGAGFYLDMLYSF